MLSIAASGSGNTLEINRSLLSATMRWFVDESVLWGILDGFFMVLAVALDMQH